MDAKRSFSVNKKIFNAQHKSFLFENLRERGRKKKTYDRRQLPKNVVKVIWWTFRDISQSATKIFLKFIRSTYFSRYVALSSNSSFGFECTHCRLEALSLNLQQISLIDKWNCMHFSSLFYIRAIRAVVDLPFISYN